MLAVQCLAPTRATTFLGVPLNVLTMRETEALILDAMRDRRPMQHVAMNVAKFVYLRHDRDLRDDVFGADLVSVDGMGILIGARMLGVPIPERVTGVDLMENLLARCAEQGLRPYLLGARPEVLRAAVQELARRHPTLRLAGSRDGYFTAEEEAGVVQAVCDARPDCLFVGMPTPRKERFMAAHRAALGASFVMGVGGGIDILAGHVPRAPRAWQRSGFEWLYRLLREPRRMWRRYLVTNLAFAVILAGTICGRALGTAAMQLEKLALGIGHAPPRPPAG